MAGRYPKEFKEDLVPVARDRAPGETLEQIATDFGVHPATLLKRLKQADIEDGIKPKVTADHAAELRELRRRNRRMKQEVEALRRTAAYLSQMLLSESSGHGCGFEEAEEIAGVVPLQAAHRLPFRLPFAGPVGDVVLGRLVVLGAGQDDGVQCAVQLTVAAA